VDFLFRRTKMLESKIDEFMDAVSEGALVFQEAIRNYLSHDEDAFAHSIEAISKLEKDADQLRRSVESQLYTHALIPEHRGDVLGLLETMDNVIDTAKSTLNCFSIEKPDISMDLMREFVALAEKAALAAESVVLASRSFFRDANAVKDHLHKVYFYEKEADALAASLKRRIFQQEIDLSRKMHLSSFVQHVDFLADRAEEVADRLSIYAIKRSV